MVAPKPAKQKQPVIIKKKKIVRGHGGHHGGAWKVAYADFITAMMALFLLLWLISQGDQKLKTAIANYFRNPGVFNTQRGGVMPGNRKVSKEPQVVNPQTEEMALVSSATMLRKAFDKRPEFGNVRGQIKIEITDEGLRIQILDRASEVLFDRGSAQLKENMVMILREIAGEVGKLPNPVVVGGHTDAFTFKAADNYTNWELSADRANAARRVLETAGLSKGQVKRVVGHGDSEPINPADPYDPANRRISVLVLRTYPRPTSVPVPPPASSDKKPIPTSTPVSKN